MSTVTGRQLEFETVDLEALRDAFRDHMAEEQSKAEKGPFDRPARVAGEAKAAQEKADADLLSVVRETIVPEEPEKQEKADADLLNAMRETVAPGEHEGHGTADTAIAGAGKEAIPNTAETVAEAEVVPTIAETAAEAEVVPTIAETVAGTDAIPNAAETLAGTEAVSTIAETEVNLNTVGTGRDADEAAPAYLQMVIDQLSKKYEDKHRMSMELSSDVFRAIGKAKATARADHEEATRKVEDASAVVDDATRKLKIIEKRYEKARNGELLVKRELQSLPYVAEAAIAEARKDVERDRDDLAGLTRDLPRAEKVEVTARAEALTALKAVLEPEAYAAEKKKILEEAEKLRNLTDYLLTVAKKSQSKENLEAEYAAARREASIRSAAYSDAYREYSRAKSLLEDARLFAREKRNIYDAAHKDTMKIRRKISAFTELIEAEEKKISGMVAASARYDEVFAKYQDRKKARLVRARQLDAAREEYARLLNVLAESKSRAEEAAERMYRAEKISVRDVIETNVKDPDFLYLNRYGALLAKAQADEQAALGKLRRALKNSDTV